MCATLLFELYILELVLLYGVELFVALLLVLSSCALLIGANENGLIDAA